MSELKGHRTDRGFVRYDFTDRYGDECSIQDSSLATEDAIWLGQGSERMHLTKELVGDLIPLLEYFLEYGRLPAPEQDQVLNEWRAVHHDGQGGREVEGYDDLDTMVRQAMLKHRPDLDQAEAFDPILRALCTLVDHGGLSLYDSADGQKDHPPYTYLTSGSADMNERPDGAFDLSFFEDMARECMADDE